MRAPRLPERKRWSWRSRAFRGLVYQIIAVIVIGLAAWFLATNTAHNMRVRGIQSGFDFLGQTAGFDIGESLFEYDSFAPYWRAFLVGILNTLRVALVGIVVTTILGTLVGIGRLSRNALIRGACGAYVETFRNIPILLQLLMWYLFFTEALPAVYEAWEAGPFFLSKNGVNFPAPVWNAGAWWPVLGLFAGIVLALVYRRWSKRRFAETGKPPSMLLIPLALIVGGTLLGWLLGGASTEFDIPRRGEYSVEHGGALTPEFLAVLLGLTIYTAAFVAEVVRAGVMSVSQGQSEAAAALGLNRTQTTRLVMLPQALRVIIPPLTNQYLNLTKNSSLAVAIGYPDVVSIANTALNQTGRAVECIAIVMLVYLITSLGTSGLMNWYNARAAIKER